METVKNKLYENRTWKYLIPCLKFYGEPLVGYLQNLFKVAVGIQDLNDTPKDHCIYVLFNTNFCFSQKIADAVNFTKFLCWVKEQDFYVKDYVFSDIEEERGLHMVVFKIPDKHMTTYSYFVKGEYSKMYTKDDFNLYFNPMYCFTNPDSAGNILLKNKRATAYFIDKIKQDLDVVVTEEIVLKGELDYPIKKEQEIFNF